MTIVHRHDEDHEAASWEASISSWVDGESEIRAEELDTPYGRQVWASYHLIGDVLRSEELAIKPSDMFYARLSRAIDDEPPFRSRRVHLLKGWGSGLSGLALAAAVAAVVWIALPYIQGASSHAPTQAAAPTAPTVVASSDEAGLHDYYDAHRGVVGVVPLRQVSFEGGLR